MHTDLLISSRQNQATITDTKPLIRLQEASISETGSDIMSLAMGQSGGRMSLRCITMQSCDKHNDRHGTQSGRGSLCLPGYELSLAHFLSLLCSPAAQVHYGKGNGRESKPKKEKEDEERQFWTSKREEHFLFI